MKKASTEFAVGKNNIGWIGSDFQEVFYGMSFTPAKTPLTEKRVLPESMNDKEILEKFKPESVTLGDLYTTLPTLDRKEWYIFYIADKKRTVWAVSAGWRAGIGWGVVAFSIEYPFRWYGGDQVLSRGFSDTLASSSPSDTLPDELVINSIRYRKVKSTS